jgi:hypothetical protein
MLNPVIQSRKILLAMNRWDGAVEDDRVYRIPILPSTLIPPTRSISRYGVGNLGTARSHVIPSPSTYIQEYPKFLKLVFHLSQIALGANPNIVHS